jgi:DNA-binding MarR family transcriptional regulator
MVTKTISPENQRITIVDLTEKGKKAIETYKKQRSERFQTLFEAIKVTDEEKNVLLRVIGRAIPFFDKHLGQKNSSST